MAVAGLVVALLVAANAVALRIETEHARREPAVRRAEHASDLAQRLERALTTEIAKAAALAGGMARSRTPGDEFPKLIEATDVSHGGAYRSAAWLNGDGTCEFAWTCTTEGVLRPGARLTGGAWEEALRRARQERRGQVVSVDRVSNPGEMLIVVPATSGEGTSPGFQGYVAARLAVSSPLEPVLAASHQAEYEAAVTSDGVPLAASTSGGTIDPADAATETRVVGVLNRSFEVRVRAAGPALDAGWGGVAAYRALWPGWLALVAAAGFWFYAHRRWRADASVAHRQLEAVRSLTEAAGVVSAAPGSAQQALDGLARTARDLFRTRVATVWVIGERDGRAAVIARACNPFQPLGLTYTLDDLPGTRECLRGGGGGVVVVDDVDRETGGRVNTDILRAHGLRSAMIVPLTLGGRVIGTLFLGHDRRDAFSDSDRRLARLLGSQAGVILASVELLGQKDAALAAQKELTRRHEALFQIATEIFRAPDLEASLQRMSDTAPVLLGVDLCVVSLRDGPDVARVAAVTGNYANCVGERTTVTNVNIGRVWQSKRPLVIEDAREDATLNPQFRYRMHVGAVMYLPLVGQDGEAIGAMTLVRHEPASFTPEQRELADLLAARAAVAIETSRLHDDARRAADAQAMLLRELNHRVKNNLASIVALLAMDRPPMPQDALAWVNRVGERIATMARTHELFVGGNDRVEVQDLVARLLPALTLIKPRGSDVQTDFIGPRVELDTERAVSLAMVLNELCWNGLEHGTPVDGVLRIRGNSTRAGRLVLEVEDQGCHGDIAGEHGFGGHGDGVSAADGSGHEFAVATATAASGRGTGLRLVEGLVSRELRGRFTVTRTVAGGTIARVEFPLEHGGSVDVS